MSSEEGTASETTASEEEFEVQKIIGKRVKNGNLQYKIRWVGYTPLDDTWEDKSNLHCSVLIDEYEREAEKKQTAALKSAQKPAGTKRRSRSTTRSTSRSSVVSMESSNENEKPSKKSAVKSSTPSQAIKPKDGPSASKSNVKKAVKNTPSFNDTPLITQVKISSSSTMSTPKSYSTSKEKTNISSKLFDKNPSGSRQGMTPSQREFYESTADHILIVPSNLQNSVFNNLVNQIERSSNGDTNMTPAPETMVTISNVLSKNPPILKNEAADISNSILSPAITKSAAAASSLNGESSIGIVEGRLLNNCFDADINGQPILPQDIPPSSIPDNHQCFGSSPTIYEFSKKDIVIYNVNNQRMEKVFAKQWKLRCTDCTDKYTVDDNTVEFVFCLLSYENANYFMIKLINCNNELYLIDAQKFRTLCQKKYFIFVCITREYFDTLGDLGLAINEQTEVVKRCLNHPTLLPYKTGAEVDPKILQGPVLRPEILQTIREIGRLFFLELQMAIGKFMCKSIDISELHQFVKDFYKNRDQMYVIVKEEAVENIYETLYMALISENSAVY